MAKKTIPPPREKLPYIPYTVRIEGLLQSLMNNGEAKNPLYVYAKEMKKYSAKKKKVDDDYIEMMRWQFYGALYMVDDDLSKVYDGEHPFWPADNIHACLKTAAKLVKLGKDFDSCIVIPFGGGRLIYDGPTTRFSLWEDQRFRHTKPTRRGVICCRPKFSPGWRVEFGIRLFEGKVMPEQLFNIIQDAGRFIGLSDWPRRHGLFRVVEIIEEEREIDLRDHGVW